MNSAGADTVLNFNKISLNISNATELASGYNNAHNLSSVSISAVTTSIFSFVMTVKGGAGIGYSIDTISCSDISSIIKNLISEPRFSNASNDSALHSYAWIIQANIGSTISVSIPKNEYNSTVKGFIFSL